MPELLSISSPTSQRAGPKFVANLPITFPKFSKIVHELRNKVRKHISMFELL